MQKGRLIVIEGIDGSGKTTQIELLTKSLQEKNIPFEVISFPRYGDNIYADLVTRYLEGEFGDINSVSPALMALAYAGDRALARPVIQKWLEEGKVVIANRYISASKAHMGANLPEEKRADFFKWLDELEYQTNNMPKEDLTILLQVNPEVAQKNIVGVVPDIHEESLKHLAEAAKIYLQLAQINPNWKIIECSKEGQMRSKENIHQDVLNSVNLF